MNEPIAALKLAHVDVGYPGQPPLARDWSATFNPGVTLLLGDTGSGKSTLLRVLAGVQQAGGRLVLDGIDLAQDPGAYRDRVCWIDPSADVDDQAVVSTLPAALGVDAARWAPHAHAFGLDPHLAKPLYMLSTGSRRKVGLAAALASRRPLLLLDEPTGALDARSIAHLMAALADEAARRGRIVIVASSQALPPAVALAALVTLPIQGTTLTR